MTFQLNIMTKLNDDMLQIIEQILPYFQPHYTLTVKFLGNLEEKRDIPIQLDDITMTDDQEGNFDQRRHLSTFSHSQAQNFPVWSCGGCYWIHHQESYCWLPGRHHPWCLVKETSLTLLLQEARQGLRWRRNNICLRQHRSHHTDHSRWRFFRSPWLLHLC